LAVSTAEKVAFLGSPEAYSYRPLRVDVTETHMSWVFIAGGRVYKLKKPVRYPFLDFRTLAAREANCREEVRLNRRLAPDVYFGVVPLTKKRVNGLALDGRGEVVDWLVEMRRLPQGLMLDRAILEHTVERDCGDLRIDAVADLLIAFYRACPPADISPLSYVQQFAREQAITEAVLRDPRFSLDKGRVDYALDRVRRGLEEDAGILQDRVKHGRVVEGHGDLRPEHVCLSDPPVIIDCLEFSRALRLVDPFDELTFLALECARLDAAWIGERLIARCADALVDAPSPRLLEFYWTYRACLRARQALAHLLEPDPREPWKWVPLANRYLALAQARAITPALRAVP
jgi:aminoglycoside phosphotransferase family enzyme